MTDLFTNRERLQIHIPFNLEAATTNQNSSLRSHNALKKGKYEKPIWNKLETKWKMWVLHFNWHILQVCLILESSVYRKMIQEDSKFFYFPYF